MPPVGKKTIKVNGGKILILAKTAPEMVGFASLRIEGSIKTTAFSASSTI